MDFHPPPEYLPVDAFLSASVRPATRFIFKSQIIQTHVINTPLLITVTLRVCISPNYTPSSRRGNFCFLRKMVNVNFFCFHTYLQPVNICGLCTAVSVRQAKILGGVNSLINSIADGLQLPFTQGINSRYLQWGQHRALGSCFAVRSARTTLGARITPRAAFPASYTNTTRVGLVDRCDPLFIQNLESAIGSKKEKLQVYTFKTLATQIQTWR